MLQPLTTSNEEYYKIDKGKARRVKEANTGGRGWIIVTTNISNNLYVRCIFCKVNESSNEVRASNKSNKLFGEEKDFYSRLILNKKFLKEHRGQYIAIKGAKILGFNSSFSEIAKKVYKNRANLGKVFIKKVSEKEEIIHFDSPLY